MNNNGRRRRLVKDGIGIGTEDEAAEAVTLRRYADMGLKSQDRYRLFKAASDRRCALGRMTFDVVEYRE